MPCMGMVNIKFNKMIIPELGRRGEIRNGASILFVIFQFLKFFKINVTDS